MKLSIALPLCVLMIGSASAASLADMPNQKPGLWKMTVTSAGMPGGGRSFQICEDAAFIAASKASAQARLKKDCTSTSSLRKVGETWVSDSDCTISGMHVISHTVTTIHGDDLYHTNATSTTVKANGSKSTDVMTMDNQWLGACKVGQKVGVPEAGT